MPQSSTRHVPASIPQPSESFAKQSHVMRKIAATDFICDPDGHSIRWHYERKDRLYTKMIAWRTFETWAITDDWTSRREAYWEQIESRVRQHMADEILRRRLIDLEKFEARLNELDKFLDPLKDPETGETLTDEFGLPKYKLELPSMDKFIVMYLKLHERVMLLRGEATSRSEQLKSPSGDDGEGPLNRHLQGHSRIVPQLSRGDARAMAAEMLRRREPALQAAGVKVEENHEASDSDDDQDLSDGPAADGSS